VLLLLNVKILYQDAQYNEKDNDTKWNQKNTTECDKGKKHISS
jgi:hypothetical protein